MVQGCELLRIACMHMASCCGSCTQVGGVLVFQTTTARFLVCFRCGSAYSFVLWRSYRARYVFRCVTSHRGNVLKAVCAAAAASAAVHFTMQATMLTRAFLVRCLATTSPSRACGQPLQQIRLLIGSSWPAGAGRQMQPSGVCYFFTTMLFTMS
jgi:hypothetical protein